MPIATEAIPDDEYLLLSAAVSAAEVRAPVAVRAALGVSGSVFSDALTLYVRAAPAFPVALHEALVGMARVPARLFERLEFSLCRYDRVVEVCAAFGYVVGVPPWLLTIGRRLVGKRVEGRVVKAIVGEVVWDMMFPFQREAILRAVGPCDGRVLFADDMGLGKTIQALVVSEYYRQMEMRENRDSGGEDGERVQSLEVVSSWGKGSTVLVLCPATLRDAWAEAVSKWLPDVNGHAVHTVSSSRDLRILAKDRCASARDPWDAAPAISYIICSYDVLPRVSEELTADAARVNSTSEAVPLLPRELSFPIVIADECHSLRNMSTARSRAVLPVLLAAKRRILVSGTPALSKPIELYPLLHALLTESVSSEPLIPYDAFLERYCGGVELAFQNRTITNVDELNAVLASVMVRRVKSEVLDCLPPKYRRHVLLELSEARLGAFAKLNAQLGSVQHDLKKTSLLPAQRATLRSRCDAIYSSLYTATASAKIPGVVTRLRQLLFDASKPKLKIIVFAHHLQVLDAVQSLLGRERVMFVRIDGATRMDQRSELVQAFQSDARVRVAVLSVAVAGTGLTLTAADLVFFSELEWVPGLLTQAEDRAHRIGRTGAVHIEYAVAPGTLDDRMWATLSRKLVFLNETVDGSERGRRVVLDDSARNARTPLKVAVADTESAVADATFDMPMYALDAHAHEQPASTMTPVSAENVCN